MNSLESPFFFKFLLSERLCNVKKTHYRARYICEDSKDYVHRGEEDKVRFNER